MRIQTSLLFFYFFPRDWDSDLISIFGKEFFGKIHGPCEFGTRLQGGDDSASERYIYQMI